MTLDQLERNLVERQSTQRLRYELGPPATEQQLRSAEGRLNAQMPRQVRLFYSTYNGPEVALPALAISPIEALVRDNEDLVHFATFDGDHHVYFNVGRENVAEQWDVLGPDRQSRITMTMASFWSNKIWKWIDREGPIWRADWPDQNP